MKNYTLELLLKRTFGTRSEQQGFDSLWVARYIGKEAYTNDRNVLEVTVIDNKTGEVMYHKNETEEYYAKA